MVVVVVSGGVGGRAGGWRERGRGGGEEVVREWEEREGGREGVEGHVGIHTRRREREREARTKETEQGQKKQS